MKTKDQIEAATYKIETLATVLRGFAEHHEDKCPNMTRVRVVLTDIIEEIKKITKTF